MKPSHLVTTACSMLLSAFCHLGHSQTLQPLAIGANDKPGPPWRVVGLPKAGKAPTRFDIVTLDGFRVLRVASDNAYANLIHELPATTVSAGAMLRWRWRLDRGLPLADLQRKSGDDVPIKVCAMFDLPLSKLGLTERSFLRLARSVSSEFLPAATLCYVWDHRLPVGTEIPNAFTKRVRYLVVNSGNAQLKQWVSHERNLAADFLKAFGHESDGWVPPLVAILVGADSDTTDGSSLAYASDLVLTNGP